jgi:hypothetical protein
MTDRRGVAVSHILASVCSIHVRALFAFPSCLRLEEFEKRIIHAE